VRPEERVIGQVLPRTVSLRSNSRSKVERLAVIIRYGCNELVCISNYRSPRAPDEGPACRETATVVWCPCMYCMIWLTSTVRRKTSDSLQYDVFARG
jgi:hypothetical protein